MAAATSARNVFTRAIFPGESQRSSSRMPRFSTGHCWNIAFFFFFWRVEEPSGFKVSQTRINSSYGSSLHFRWGLIDLVRTIGYNSNDEILLLIGLSVSNHSLPCLEFSFFWKLISNRYIPSRCSRNFRLINKISLPLSSFPFPSFSITPDWNKIKWRETPTWLAKQLKRSLIIARNTFSLKRKRRRCGDEFKPHDRGRGSNSLGLFSFFYFFPSEIPVLGKKLGYETALEARQTFSNALRLNGDAFPPPPNA